MSSSTIQPAVAVPAPAMAHKRTSNRAMFLVGVFELCKATLFLAAAVGILRLVHKDTAVELTKLLHALRINGDREFIKNLLTKANVLGDGQKQFWSIMVAAYAILHGIEGVGLVMRKKWGEWFTVIASGLMIPYEIYEIFHRTSHPAHADVLNQIPVEQRTTFVFDQMLLLKIGFFLANVAIVWFLAYHIRKSHRQKMELEREAATPDLVEEGGAINAGAPQ